MKHRFSSVLLASVLAFALAAPSIPAADAGVTDRPVMVSLHAQAAETPDEASVYNAMIALQDEYPEGMEWTNDNFYAWNGGIYSGGYGCVGFAFILSDAAFGTLPARLTTTFDPASVRVGDILRNYGHSYIVLEVHEDYFIIAEGNFNSSIHWGRKVSFDSVADGFEEHITRYPEEGTTTPTEDPDGVYEVDFWLEFVPPEKETYYVGEALDLSDINASVCYIISYWDGSSEYYSFEVPTEDLEITGFSSETAGPCSVQLAYECEIPHVGWARMATNMLLNIVEAPSGILGDANEDGEVDVLDIIAINRYLLGGGSLAEQGDANADVDGNGEVDGNDSLLIMKFIVKLIETL